MVSPQNDPEFSLALSLLHTWSLADAELRPKIEALIAEYAARKPYFVQTLQRVTNVSEQMQEVSRQRMLVRRNQRT